MMTYQDLKWFRLIWLEQRHLELVKFKACHIEEMSGSVKVECETPDTFDKTRELNRLLKGVH